MFKIYHKFFVWFYARKLRKLEFPDSRTCKYIDSDTDPYNSLIDKWAYHSQKYRN